MMRTIIIEGIRFYVDREFAGDETSPWVLMYRYGEHCYKRYLAPPMESVSVALAKAPSEASAALMDRKPIACLHWRPLLQSCCE